MLLSKQYIGTTITHLRGERMMNRLFNSFVSVSSVLRSTDKRNNPSNLSCTIVDLNRVFIRVIIHLRTGVPIRTGRGGRVCVYHVSFLKRNMQPC